MTAPREDIDFLCENPFRMGRGEFARTLFLEKGLSAVCVLSILFIVGIFIGWLVDLRFMILSAMIIFIITPMLMGYLYYYHALGKYYHFNVVDHNISFLDNGLRITMYFPMMEESDTMESDSENTDKLSCKTIDYTIRYSDFSGCVSNPNSALFHIGVPANGFLWLPVSAFGSIEKFNDTVNEISTRILCGS